MKTKLCPCTISTSSSFSPANVWPQTRIPSCNSFLCVSSSWSVKRYFYKDYLPNGHILQKLKSNYRQHLDCPPSKYRSHGWPRFRTHTWLILSFCLSDTCSPRLLSSLLLKYQKILLGNGLHNTTWSVLTLFTLLLFVTQCHRVNTNDQLSHENFLFFSRCSIYTE